MIRHAGLSVLLAFACLAGPYAQCAQQDERAIQSAQPERLSDGELSEQRGGFSWQGLDIQLGAEIRSYLGNELVMLTNVTWTDAGSNVQRTVSDALTPAAPDQSGTIRTDGLTIRSGNQSVYLANNAQTAFIQRTDGVFQNILANVASNVDLRQEVDIKVDIANFAPFRDGILASRIGAALSAMGNLELVRTTPN